MPLYQTTPGRVRLLGMAEGISFLVLLGIAMPLKYLAGMPEAVKWAGSIHGILFILFCLAILQALVEGHLTFGWACAAFISAFLPFGPFVFEKALAAADTRQAAAQRRDDLQSVNPPPN